MQYKTMMLWLLEQHPELHERLRSQRQLLATVESQARLLKSRHEAWMEMLPQAMPQSDPSQISSSALELALKEWEDCLAAGSLPGEPQPLSLEAAMAFIRHPSQPE